MIVERVSHYPRLGRHNDLVKLFADAPPFSNPHVHAIRVYLLDLGSSAPLVMELEFESYGEREQFWADFGADPGTPAGFEKYWGLVDHRMVSETWKLEE